MKKLFISLVTWVLLSGVAYAQSINGISDQVMSGFYPEVNGAPIIVNYNIYKGLVPKNG